MWCELNIFCLNILIQLKRLFSVGYDTLKLSLRPDLKEREFFAKYLTGIQKGNFWDCLLKIYVIKILKILVMMRPYQD